MTAEQRINAAWQSVAKELELPPGSGPSAELRQAWLDSITTAIAEKDVRIAELEAEIAELKRIN